MKIKSTIFLNRRISFLIRFYRKEVAGSVYLERSRETRIIAKSSSRQQGQMLMVMLFIMLVGLTVGLFLLGRTSSDISQTTNLTDSARAFNAAEAGIEEFLRSLNTGTPAVPLPSGDVSYTIQSATLTSGIFPENKGALTDIGEKQTAFLVPHNSDGTLNITATYTANIIHVCYDSQPNLSFLVTMYYMDGTQIRSTNYGYSESSTKVADGFEQVSGTATGCSGYGYDSQFTVDIFNDMGLDLMSDILLAIRVRPLTVGTYIAILGEGGGGGVLPGQGESVESRGFAGDTVRRIVLERPYEAPPPFLDDVIYSRSQITDLQ